MELPSHLRSEANNSRRATAEQQAATTVNSDPPPPHLPIPSAAAAVVVHLPLAFPTRGFLEHLTPSSAMAAQLLAALKTHSVVNTISFAPPQSGYDFSTFAEESVVSYRTVRRAVGALTYQLGARASTTVEDAKTTRRLGGGGKTDRVYVVTMRSEGRDVGAAAPTTSSGVNADNNDGGGSRRSRVVKIRLWKGNNENAKEGGGDDNEQAPSSSSAFAERGGGDETTTNSDTRQKDGQQGRRLSRQNTEKQRGKHQQQARSTAMGSRDSRREGHKTKNRSLPCSLRPSPGRMLVDFICDPQYAAFTNALSVANNTADEADIYRRVQHDRQKMAQQRTHQQRNNAEGAGPSQPAFTIVKHDSSRNTVTDGSGGGGGGGGATSTVFVHDARSLGTSRDISAAAVAEGNEAEKASAATNHVAKPAATGAVGSDGNEALLSPSSVSSPLQQQQEPAANPLPFSPLAAHTLASELVYNPISAKMRLGYARVIDAVSEASKTVTTQMLFLPWAFNRPSDDAMEAMYRGAMALRQWESASDKSQHDPESYSHDHRNCKSSSTRKKKGSGGGNVREGGRRDFLFFDPLKARAASSFEGLNMTAMGGRSGGFPFCCCAPQQSSPSSSGATLPSSCLRRFFASCNPITFCLHAATSFTAGAGAGKGVVTRAFGVGPSSASPAFFAGKPAFSSSSSAPCPIPCLLIKNPNAKFLVIAFHANATDVGFAAQKAFFFSLSCFLPATVLLVEYPGYGLHSGEPSESAVKRTAEAVVQYVCATSTNLSPRQIILYGMSIGTGLAVHAANVLTRAAKKWEDEAIRPAAMIKDRTPSANMKEETSQKRATRSTFSSHSPSASLSSPAAAVGEERSKEALDGGGVSPSPSVFGFVSEDPHARTTQPPPPTKPNMSSASPPPRWWHRLGGVILVAPYCSVAEIPRLTLTNPALTAIETARVLGDAKRSSRRPNSLEQRDKSGAASGSFSIDMTGQGSDASCNTNNDDDGGHAQNGIKVREEAGRNASSSSSSESEDAENSEYDDNSDDGFGSDMTGEDKEEEDEEEEKEVFSPTLRWKKNVVEPKWLQKALAERRRREDEALLRLATLTREGRCASSSQKENNVTNPGSKKSTNGDKSSSDANPNTNAPRDGKESTDDNSKEGNEGFRVIRKITDAAGLGPEALESFTSPLLPMPSTRQKRMEQTVAAFGGVGATDEQTNTAGIIINESQQSKRGEDSLGTSSKRTATATPPPPPRPPAVTALAQVIADAVDRGDLNILSPDDENEQQEGTNEHSVREDTTNRSSIKQNVRIAVPSSPPPTEEDERRDTRPKRTFGAQSGQNASAYPKHRHDRRDDNYRHKNKNVDKMKNSFSHLDTFGNTIVYGKAVRLAALSAADDKAREMEGRKRRGQGVHQPSSSASPPSPSIDDATGGERSAKKEADLRKALAQLRAAEEEKRRQGKNSMPKREKGDDNNEEVIIGPFGNFPLRHLMANRFNTAKTLCEMQRDLQCFSTVSKVTIECTTTTTCTTTANVRERSGSCVSSSSSSAFTTSLEVETVGIPLLLLHGLYDDTIMCEHSFEVLSRVCAAHQQMEREAMLKACSAVAAQRASSTSLNATPSAGCYGESRNSKKMAAETAVEWVLGDSATIVPSSSEQNEDSLPPSSTQTHVTMTSTTADNGKSNAALSIHPAATKTSTVIITKTLYSPPNLSLFLHPFADHNSLGDVDVDVIEWFFRGGRVMNFADAVEKPLARAMERLIYLCDHCYDGVKDCFLLCGDDGAVSGDERDEDGLLRQARALILPFVTKARQRKETKQIDAEEDQQRKLAAKIARKLLRFNEDRNPSLKHAYYDQATALALMENSSSQSKRMTHAQTTPTTEHVLRRGREKKQRQKQQHGFLTRAEKMMNNNTKNNGEEEQDDNKEMSSSASSDGDGEATDAYRDEKKNALIDSQKVATTTTHWQIARRVEATVNAARSILVEVTEPIPEEANVERPLDASASDDGSRQQQEQPSPPISLLTRGLFSLCNVTDDVFLMASDEEDDGDDEQTHGEEDGSRDDEHEATPASFAKEHGQNQQSPHRPSSSSSFSAENVSAGAAQPTHHNDNGKRSGGARLLTRNPYSRVNVPGLLLWRLREASILRDCAVLNSSQCSVCDAEEVTSCAVISAASANVLKGIKPTKKIGYASAVARFLKSKHDRRVVRHRRVIVAFIFLCAALMAALLAMYVVACYTENAAAFISPSSSSSLDADGVSLFRLPRSASSPSLSSSAQKGPDGKPLLKPIVCAWYAGQIVTFVGVGLLSLLSPRLGMGQLHRNKNRDVGEAVIIAYFVARIVVYVLFVFGFGILIGAVFAFSPSIAERATGIPWTDAARNAVWATTAASNATDVSSSSSIAAVGDYVQYSARYVSWAIDMPRWAMVGCFIAHVCHMLLSLAKNK